MTVNEFSFPSEPLNNGTIVELVKLKDPKRIDWYSFVSKRPEIINSDELVKESCVISPKIVLLRKVDQVLLS